MHSMASEPCVHSVDATRMGSNELLDCFLGQMRAVASVKWVADLRKVLLELGEARLGQRDVQLQDVRGGGAAQLSPATRRHDGLAECQPASGALIARGD